MKFPVEVKGRAALREAIEKAVVAECASLELSEDERTAVVKARAKKTLEVCGLWFKDGSTATLEVDTDAGTCVVVAA